MTEPRSPAELAYDTAAVIRSINHLTLRPGDDWRYPGHVYDLVGGLTLAMLRMPQTLGQASLLLAELNQSGLLRSDTGELDDDLVTALDCLADAFAGAENLYECLNRAHSALSSLSYEDGTSTEHPQFPRKVDEDVEKVEES